MVRRRGYMQFLILVLLLIFEGAAIPKLQYDASYFSLDASILSKDFFRSHELTEDLILYMRNAKEPGRAAGIYLLEQNYHSEYEFTRYLRVNYHSEYEFPAYSDQIFRSLETQWQSSPSFRFVWKRAKRSGQTLSTFLSCSGKKSRI